MATLGLLGVGELAVATQHLSALWTMAPGLGIEREGKPPFEPHEDSVMVLARILRQCVKQLDEHADWRWRTEMEDRRRESKIEVEGERAHESERPA